MSRSTLGPERVAPVESSSLSAAAPVVDAAADRIRALGFWSAVALPLAYVPLLATGIETADGGLLVLALLAAHLLALLLGRGYDPE